MDKYVKFHQNINVWVNNCHSNSDLFTCTFENVMVSIKKMKPCQRRLGETENVQKPLHWNKPLVIFFSHVYWTMLMKSCLPMEEEVDASGVFVPVTLCSASIKVRERQSASVKKSKCMWGCYAQLRQTVLGKCVAIPFFFWRGLITSILIGILWVRVN